MSDEQEQERDGYPEATTIGPNVNAAQLELDIDAISRRTRKFLVEQQNTIDRLTAERDQAREQLAKLRAACDGTPWLLETARERDGSSWDYPWPEVYDDAAARIRAALGIESEAGE